MIEKVKNKIISCVHELEGSFGLIGIFSFIFLTLLFFCWFVSDPVRSGKIDRYILLSMTETSRVFFVKASYADWTAILNPNAKPLYAMLLNLFTRVTSLSLFSFKICNSMLSMGVLIFLFRLVKKMEFNNTIAMLAVIFTITFPLYFLLSISATGEILFCFMGILTLNFLYEKRYRLTVFTAAFLPLARQEGIFYLLIIAFILLKEKRIRDGCLLFLPSLAWICFNKFFLNHSMIYPFFWQHEWPGPTPQYSIVEMAEFIPFARLIFSHPVFFLLPIGIVLLRKNRKTWLLFLFFIPHLIFLLTIAILQYLLIGKISYQFRYFVPLSPFLAIFSASVFERVFRSGNRAIKATLGIILSISLCILTVGNIRAIGKFSRIKEEQLSDPQEKEVIAAARWMKDFSQKNDIDRIFYSGQFTTHKVIRRLRMSFVPEIVMYPIRHAAIICDPVKFTFISETLDTPFYKGLIIVFDPRDEAYLLSFPRITFVHRFCDIGLSVYQKY